MVTSLDVILFVPNLIGYVRVFLALLSFYFMTTDYLIASTCYIVSGLLDAFDGYAARKLGQSSKFGAMLDQLTDRAATACLVVTLATFYPQYTFLFQLSLAVDIVSHWMHLHASQLQGRGHKTMGLDSNPIMKLYYTSRIFLFFMCAGNELFFSMLYVLNFTEGFLVSGVGIVRILMYASAPVMLVKSLISIVHLIEASIMIAAIDAREINEKSKAK